MLITEFLIRVLFRQLFHTICCDFADVPAICFHKAIDMTLATSTADSDVTLCGGGIILSQIFAYEN